jgi:hypothetical protein
LKAWIEKLVGVGQQDEKSGGTQAIEKDWPATGDQAGEDYRGHDRRADTGGFQAGHQDIQEQHGNDQSGSMRARSSKDFQKMPKQNRDHPDVQAADREQMKGSGAAEFLLNALRERRNIAQNHGHQELCNGRVVHLFNQGLPQPRARAQGKGYHGIATTVRRDLLVASVAELQQVEYSTTRQPSSEIELSRVTRRLDRFHGASQQHFIPVIWRRTQPFDLEKKGRRELDVVHTKL